MELRTVATGVLVSRILVLQSTIRGSGVRGAKGGIGVVMTATRLPMTAGHGQIGLGSTGPMQTNGGSAGTVISGGPPAAVGGRVVEDLFESGQRSALEQ